MASVDYTYFTDADMPQENMKDWHTCLKAKQISLLKKKKNCFLCYSHLFVSVGLVFCFPPPRTCPFLLYECMFVFICAYTLQIHHVCVMIVYREGFCSSLTGKYAPPPSLLLFNPHVPLRLLLYIRFSHDPPTCHTTINFTLCPISPNGRVSRAPAFYSDTKD